MLKLISYTDEMIAATVAGLNSIDFNRVQSVSVYASDKDQDGCRPVLNPDPLFSVDGSEAREFLQGSIKTIPYIDILSKNEEVVMKIFSTGNYTIATTIIDDVEVKGVGIMNDFVYSDEIKLGERVYKVDRYKSSINKVVTTKPIREAVTEYQTALVSTEYLLPLQEIITKCETLITGITSCCDDKVNGAFDRVMKITALQKAIKCNDKKAAITLYKYLK